MHWHRPLGYPQSHSKPSPQSKALPCFTAPWELRLSWTCHLCPQGSDTPQLKMRLHSTLPHPQQGSSTADVLLNAINTPTNAINQ